MNTNSRFSQPKIKSKLHQAPPLKPGSPEARTILFKRCFKYLNLLSLSQRDIQRHSQIRRIKKIKTIEEPLLNSQRRFSQLIKFIKPRRYGTTLKPPLNTSSLSSKDSRLYESKLLKLMKIGLRISNLVLSIKRETGMELKAADTCRSFLATSSNCNLKINVPKLQRLDALLRPKSNSQQVMLSLNGTLYFSGKRVPFRPVTRCKALLKKVTLIKFESMDPSIVTKFLQSSTRRLVNLSAISLQDLSNLHDSMYKAISNNLSSLPRLQSLHLRVDDLRSFFIDFRLPLTLKSLILDFTGCKFSELQGREDHEKFYLGLDQHSRLESFKYSSRPADFLTGLKYFWPLVEQCLGRYEDPKSGLLMRDDDPPADVISSIASSVLDLTNKATEYRMTVQGYKQIISPASPSFTFERKSSQAWSLANFSAGSIHLSAENMVFFERLIEMLTSNLLSSGVTIDFQDVLIEKIAILSYFLDILKAKMRAQKNAMTICIRLGYAYGVRYQLVDLLEKFIKHGNRKMEVLVLKMVDER